MINIINEQINLVLEDLELMTNPYERSMVRVNLIGALSNVNLGSSFNTMVNSFPTGKDAIKSDIAKEDTPIQFEDKDKEEPVVEEKKEKKTTKKKETKKSTKPVEVDVDPNTAAPESTPVIIEVEGDSLDITEAYNALTAIEDEDLKKELAQNITLYTLMPIYATFETLADGEDKMMLSYYLQQVGLEDINGFVNDLSDGQFNDVYEFVNNDNLEFVVNSIAEAMPDEDEE